MEKFIPFEKLSKKEQRKRNAARRGSWYGLNTVTRKPENSKAYNRRKAQKWSDDSDPVPFVVLWKHGHDGMRFLTGEKSLNRSGERFLKASSKSLSVLCF